MVEELKWRTVEERRCLPSMEPLRADVILAGALILWRSLEILEIRDFHVSTRGLRYGLLLKS
jgi:exopolyphosphatase/guanosine-5'-triphosphate,3'-diphosphate pyrophosphatase